MTNTSTIFKSLFFFLAVFWLSGCVQTKTTPGYARAGDHIVIGLGGIERNAQGNSTLLPGDLTITITDSDDNSYDLEPRFVFQTYPDYGAQVNTFGFDGTNLQAGLTGAVPFDGGWFVVAPLTVQGQYDMPLPLSVGDATISVSSPKLTNTLDVIEGDLTAIPIEIIAGTSEPDQNFIRQFIAYVPSPKAFEISPDNLGGVDEVGGAHLVIDYNDDSFFDGGVEPIVTPTGHNPYVQLSYSVNPNGDGTGSIDILLLNPVGFKVAGGSDPNASLLSDLTVKLIYFSAGSGASAAEAKANFSLNASKSFYVDLDGAALGAVSPTLTHVEDL
ncbi:MAG: hypothetical protein AAGA91_17170 [Pseudomonadota bacterium]